MDLAAASEGVIQGPRETMEGLKQEMTNDFLKNIFISIQPKKYSQYCNNNVGCQVGLRIIREDH